MAVSKLKQARLVLECARDICFESELMGSYLETCHWLGRCLEQSKEHLLAVAVYKKQLQMAWYLDCQWFELQAYSNLGRCYFYLQNVAKSQYYMDRNLRGKLESPHSN
jgi:hypothetical protein